MDSELLLSIIIPIYNVQEYLGTCIDSVLKQNYSKLEVLLIDDGSTDRSGQICDEYAKKDVRIRVFHKENGGNADALNYGLKYCRGEYIAFVDGDDYIDNSDAFTLLIKEALYSDADIVVGNYQKDILGNLVATRPHDFSITTDSESPDFRFKGFYSVGHLAYTWGKLYKRQFLISGGLELKPYVYALDKLFNIECYLKRPKYSFVQDSVYVYRFNDSSVSHRYKEHFADIWLAITGEINNGIMRSGRDTCFDFVAFNLLFAVFFSCKQEYQHCGRKMGAVNKELKKYMSNYMVNKAVKEVFLGKHLNFKGLYMWKIFLWGLAAGLYLRCHIFISLGIKLLVEFDIDGRLSSTGKLKANN